MSDKYIIKNCPVCEFSDWEECTGYLAEGYICNNIHTKIVECQDCTDCKLKQIVEKCKKYIENYNNKVFYDEDDVQILMGKAMLSQSILSEILDIQEVE